MRRYLAYALTMVATLLIAVLIAVLALSDRTPSRPAVNMTANEASDPLKQEMECVEGVLNNNRLEANQVRPALDACR